MNSEHACEMHQSQTFVHLTNSPLKGLEADSLEFIRLLFLLMSSRMESP